MEKLSKEVLQELEDKFLGKKITVPFDKGVGANTLTGKCTFIGYNPLLPTWGLQVTIERTPVTNVNHSSIRLAE